MKKLAASMSNFSKGWISFDQAMLFLRDLEADNQKIYFDQPETMCYIYWHEI
jgi:hypothetical protein